MHHGKHSYDGAIGSKSIRYHLDKTDFGLPSGGGQPWALKLPNYHIAKANSGLGVGSIKSRRPAISKAPAYHLIP